MSRRGHNLFIALLVLLAPCRLTAAATVSISQAPDRVYADVPFVFSIAIENATSYEPPQFPVTDGLNVLAGPSKSESSFTQIVNGRVSKRSTITFTWQLAVTRTGAVTIPPLTVVADGEQHRTQPVRIDVGKAESGDMLLAEISLDRNVYYLGETIEPTLEIWLKPFFSERYDKLLDARTMSEYLDVRRSNWGPFAESLNQAQARQERRADSEGVRQLYYVYSIPAEISPQQAGAIDFSDMRIVVSYPERVRPRRSILLERGWETVQARPLVAAVEHPPVEVKAPPSEGRPPTYAGAVGTFDFAVSAKPTEVAVGDPVTLTMTITDTSHAATDLDLLQPPSLADVPGLTDDFRVPTDPLAGVVEGRRKTFTQTVRARNERVSRVPPIPFAYFDPQKQDYVAVSSDAIEINVVPATTLAMTDIVGTEAVTFPQATELTEVSAGILANYGGADLLLGHQAFTPSWVHLATVAAPPLGFAVVAMGHRRRQRLRNDHGFARRRSARRRALRRLREAGATSGGREAELTALAVSDYVADRCNLPAGTLTGPEVVERLAGLDISRDVVADVEALLSTCERLRYAGDSINADSINDRAAACIRRLERERIR